MTIIFLWFSDGIEELAKYSACDHRKKTYSIEKRKDMIISGEKNVLKKVYAVYNGGFL